MEEVIKDTRFSHIAHDPRFKKIPKREKKVKIDKRFQSMFKDKNFKVKYTVDKRGRPIVHTSGEDLKKYYAVSSDEDDLDSDTDGSESEVSSNTSKKGVDSEELQLIEEKQIKDKSLQNVSISAIAENSGEASENEVLPDTVKNKLRDLTVDYARGEGALFSDSSSDEESTEAVLEDIDHHFLQFSRPLHNIHCSFVSHHFKQVSGMHIVEGFYVITGRIESIEQKSPNKSCLSMSPLYTGTEEEEELDHDWGELDRDAERTDKVTNRLAVCHMDWDRIRASDLMVLFNSFLLKDGLIHSVTIYPSEFGLKRMKEEEVKGPIELVENKLQEEEDEDKEENEEGNSYSMEKLRRYQLNRLKYYYAILVCDSPDTANKIYTECDGLEYESSATRLDLRFVPDDTVFDQEPREICDKIPDLSKYQPRYFTTTALQQAKVELTWDETNPDRNEITQKLMSGEVDGVSEADLREYLATSSEEESDVDEAGLREGKGNKTETSDDPVAKYRSLLQEIEEQEEKKKSRDIEMEITWGVGLKDKTEKLVQKKIKEKQNELTPFEQYIEKRKEKKKQKKKERMDKLKQENDGSESGYSDDDIPSDIDMNDPYFQEEFKGDFKKKDKKDKKKETAESEVSQQEQAELELLLMNDAAEKHFSMKSIQEQESEGKKKKKRKLKMKPKIQEVKKDDDFEVDVKDERFSALFNSHHFNIDPTDSHYRKTKGMEALRAEKINRRQHEDSTSLQGVTAKVRKMDNGTKKDPELSLLIKTIKRKTQNFQKGAR